MRQECDNSESSKGGSKMDGELGKKRVQPGQEFSKFSSFDTPHPKSSIWKENKMHIYQNFCEVEKEGLIVC